VIDFIEWRRDGKPVRELKNQGSEFIFAFGIVVEGWYGNIKSLGL